MWHLLRKGKGLLFFSILSVTTSGYSDPYENPIIGQNQVPTSEMTKSAPSGQRMYGWTIAPIVGLGLGRFQNIVIPMDSSVSAARSERKEIVTVTEQQGVPLILALTATRVFEGLSTKTELRFTKMATLLGRTQGQQSTPGYSRLELGQDLRFALLSTKNTADTALQYRRDSFKDGSYAHMVDALMAKLGGTVSLLGYNASAYYEHSAYAKFGFTDRTKWMFSEVPGSKAVVQGYGLGIARPFGINSEWKFDMSREDVSISYPVEDTYAGFGLGSTGTLVKSRAVTLTTDMITMALIKHF